MIILLNFRVSKNCIKNTDLLVTSNIHDLTTELCINVFFTF